MFLPEILAPAGNLEKLRTALLYGADAMYLGGSTFNLRASCDGFTAEELNIAVQEANARNARVYYCVNNLPMQQDVRALPAIIEEAASAGVHGLIIADPGVLRLAQKYAPKVEIHLSTQSNTTNSESIHFWAEQGVTRVNLARELSCRDMHAIGKNSPNMELEVFVHGAMCLAVSGHCLLSAWLNNRPANLGRCTHPCRFDYRARAIDSILPNAAQKSAVHFEESMLHVEESMRPDETVWEVHQGEAFSSFWAPHDLCLLAYMPWFMQTGITALKIEGRMKSAAYVAHVVDAYRTALNDAHADAVANEQGNLGIGTEGVQQRRFNLARYMPEVLYTASRPLSSGFFVPGKRRNFTEEFLSTLGAPVSMHESGGKTGGPNLGHPLLAVITEPAGSGAWYFEARGTWHSSTNIELMLPGLSRPVLHSGSYAIENHKGERTEKVGSGIRGVVHIEAEGIQPGIFIRGAE